MSLNLVARAFEGEENKEGSQVDSFPRRLELPEETKMCV